jgi:hypothetical protein
MTRSLISEAERQAYGDEALSVMARAAQEVVQPIRPLTRIFRIGAGSIKIKIGKTG